jgi:uncharacterized membrane protein YhaH (DUF805 family)
LDYLKFLYFSQKGRISRSQYFLGVLGIVIVEFIVLIPTWSYGRNTGKDISAFLMILAAFLVIPAIFMNIKRLHDCNYPGAMLLLCFIPLINIYPTFIIFFSRGSPDYNNYGPNPHKVNFKEYLNE